MEQLFTQMFSNSLGHFESGCLRREHIEGPSILPINGFNSSQDSCWPMDPLSQKVKIFGLAFVLFASNSKQSFDLNLKGKLVQFLRGVSLNVVK